MRRAQPQASNKSATSQQQASRKQRACEYQKRNPCLRPKLSEMLAKDALTLTAMNRMQVSATNAHLDINEDATPRMHRTSSSARVDVGMDEDATPRMYNTLFSATFSSPGRRHRRAQMHRKFFSATFCSPARRNRRGCDTSDAQNVVRSHILFARTSTSMRMRHLECTERCSHLHSVRLGVDVGEDATRRMHRRLFSATFCSPGRRH